MYNTTADYKTYIKKPSRQFQCRITLGTRVFDNNDIIQIVPNIVQPQNGFSVGNTVSESIDITLKNDGGVYASVGTVIVEIGLKINDSIEYIPVGTFHIDDVTKTDYTVNITAYDNMVKFETPYFSSLGNTPTLQQVVNELSTITGVQFTGTVPNYTVTKLKGFTCREVLGYVASVCGGNAYITRDGKFTILYPKEINYTVTADNYIGSGYKIEDQVYKIGMITCQNKNNTSNTNSEDYDSVNDENTISVGSLSSDTMELTFENPWVTTSILNDIYNRLNGFSYLGYTMKWQGDLSLDPMDIVTVVDKNNVTRKAIIFANKLKYTGGLTAETSAKGETKNSNSFNANGPSTKDIQRLSVQLLIAEKAIITKANIKDLQANSARIDNLQANVATIDTALINYATVSQLDAVKANVANLFAADATINNTLINKANIADLTATNAAVSNLNADVANIKTLVNGNLTSANIHSLVLTSSKVTVDNGFIKNAMIESLDATKINTGSLNTGKVSVTSSDGSLLIAGATQQFKDKNGKVRIQMGQDAQGNFNFILVASDGTTTLIDGTGVKANAIADKLIKTNMVADSAIGEQQINYSSFVTGFNKSTNTSYINASKVAVNLTGQTLEVSFNNINTKVDGIKTTTDTNTTSISAIQGQISTLISNTTITKDGTTTQLKDAYNGTVATINSLSTTIGEHTTQIASANSNITSVTSRTATLETNLSSISASLSSTQSTVSTQATQISNVTTTANAAKSAIDDLSIGGRNLLIGMKNSTFTIAGDGTGTGEKIIITNYYANLEAGNTYTFGCKTDGTWGGGTGSDTVEAFLLKDKGYTKYYAMSSNPKTFTCDTTGTYYLRLDINKSNVTHNFWNVKVEKGNQATDWTPAPEDVDSSISAVNTTATTANTNASTALTNSNTAISTANSASSTATTASTNASNAVTTANSANGTANTAVTNSNTAISTANTASTNASGAVSTANKASTDVATLTTTVTNTVSRVSSLELTATSLTTRVGNTEIAISSLQVGGRNLILNSSFVDLTTWHKETNWVISTGTYQKNNVMECDRTSLTVSTSSFSDLAQSIPYEKLELNVPYTISFYIKCTANGTLPFRWYFTSITGTSADNYWSPITTTSDWVKVSKTITFTIKQNSNIPCMYFRTFDGNKVSITKPKFEKGNQATDWTPAPEDVDASIQSVKDYATTTINSNVSTINQTTTSIQAQVTSLQSSVSTINTTLGNKADTTTVTSVTNRVSTLESSVTGINASITTINSNVSSVTATANAAKSAIDNLQVGGRNLVRKSTFQYTTLPSDTNFILVTVNNVSSQSFTNEGYHYTATSTNGAPNSSRGIRINSNDFGLKIGDTFVFSSDIKGTFGTSNNGLCVMHASTTNSAFYAVVSVSTQHPATITDWTRKSRTYTIPSNIKIESDGSFYLYLFWGGGTGSAVDVYIRNVKVELGNKATDWTPAPEDIDSQITTVNSSVSSLQSSVSVLQNQIALKVEQSNIDSAVSTLNGKITAQNTTISSLQSSINLQLNSIASKVNQTVSTKNLANLKNKSGEYWTTTTSVNSKSGIAIKFPVTTSTPVVEINSLNLKQNTNYTISFTAWTESGVQVINNDLLPDTLPEKEFTITTTPTRYSWTLSSSSTDILNCAMRFFRAGGISNITWITDIQLEEGSIATDWVQSFGDNIGTIITQSPTQVMTAFNNISSYFKVNADGATFGDISTGDYTVLGANGLKHHVGGTDYDFMYITYVMDASINVFAESFSYEGNRVLNAGNEYDAINGHERSYFIPYDSIVGRMLNGRVPKFILCQDIRTLIYPDYPTTWTETGTYVEYGKFNTFNISNHYGSPIGLSCNTNGITVTGTVAAYQNIAKYYSNGLYKSTSTKILTGGSVGFRFLIFG